MSESSINWVVNLTEDGFFTSTTSTSDYRVPNGDFKIVSPPVYTWRVVIGESHETGISILFTDKKVPNWFHRKMQELTLGFKWQKL